MKILRHTWVCRIVIHITHADDLDARILCLHLHSMVIHDLTTTVTKLGIPIEMLNEDASTYKVSMETLSQIVGALSQEQASFVDEMQDYLSSTMGEKGNSVSMKLYGIEMFGEENYPLSTAPADIDGNGSVELEDAVYLLLHALFGAESYPL